VAVIQLGPFIVPARLARAAQGSRMELKTHWLQSSGRRWPDIGSSILSQSPLGWLP
jgi:hypothetical protein